VIERIRSYVRREGRITTAQQRALQQLLPEYGLSVTDGIIDFCQVFARKAPCILEIGFGMGQSLLTMAQTNPDYNFIGVEVYRPGVGVLLLELARQNITNVHVYCADAVEVLERCIPDTSLAKILLFFPDPWPKRRHQKRRIIQTQFIQLLYKKLQINGALHIVTDWEDYAQYILKVMTAIKGFKQGIPDWRPITKFEQRGVKSGHKIWDLFFIKENHDYNKSAI